MSEEDDPQGYSSDYFRHTRRSRPLKRFKKSKKRVESSSSSSSYDDDSLFKSLADICRATKYNSFETLVFQPKTLIKSDISTSDTNISKTKLLDNFVNIINLPFPLSVPIVKTKMAVTLSDIVKFTKLVGQYDADVPDASIRSHLTRLELYADIGSWEDKTKLTVATSTVKGRAFDFIAQNNYTTYKALRLDLIQKFDSLDDLALLSNKLFNLRQNKTSIREHSKNFDILLNKLKAISAPTLPTEVLMNIFIDGIHYQYKKDILLRGITTYDEAVHRAILMERLDSANEGEYTEKIVKKTSVNPKVANGQEASINAIEPEISVQGNAKISGLEEKLKNCKVEINKLNSKLNKGKNVSAMNESRDGDQKRGSETFDRGQNFHNQFGTNNRGQPNGGNGSVRGGNGAWRNNYSGPNRNERGNDYNQSSRFNSRGRNFRANYNSRNSYEIVCYNCNRRGHYAPDCWFGRNNSGNSFRGRGRGNNYQNQSGYNRSNYGNNNNGYYREPVLYQLMDEPAQANPMQAIAQMPQTITTSDNKQLVPYKKQGN